MLVAGRGQFGFVDRLERPMPLAGAPDHIHGRKPSLLARARVGAFNLHPGPLPECAGLNAPSWSIWNGADEHGVTLHWMEATIDAGTIAFEHRFPLTPTDTGLSIATRCGKAGLALLDELARAAVADAIPRVPQDATRRRSFCAAPPRDGELDWAWPAEQLIRLWRACDYGPFGAPWGQPWFRNGNRRCHVRRLSIASSGSPAGDAIPVDSDPGDTDEGAIEVGLGTGAVRIAEARCGPHLSGKRCSTHPAFRAGNQAYSRLHRAPQAFPTQ